MTGPRPWVFAVAAALGIAATLSLGAWQLGRAHQKEALADAIAQRRAGPVLPQQALLAADAPAQVYRPVRLRGTWVADRTVFLDNRQMDGRVGFYVVTPLRLSGSDRVVLVQRGWAPRDFERRERLPAVDTPPGDLEVVGRIAPPPAKLYQLGSAAGGPIRQNLDLAAFSAETGLALLPVSVQETGAPSQGLLRNWPEGVGSGPEKNYGYAFQWWALSGLIAFLYVWFQFIQPRRRQARAE
ncbi:MAG TPA: SURF1 family protein [Ramlibacter sp.]|jgi:surfeit locus 1 family protein|uniref:SURF1 family protein n=1 Tax=Ramlibacter sp. TaxID=1917967 RepID=UPI002D56CEB6|nr:SURF1 family protein [Ramlibacter sp.]HZY19897.1 SURF1 family protein [Ramlibacter sp.]